MYVIIIKITILSMSNKPKLKYYPNLLYKKKYKIFLRRHNVYEKKLTTSFLLRPSSISKLHTEINTGHTN